MGPMISQGEGISGTRSVYLPGGDLCAATTHLDDEDSLSLLRHHHWLTRCGKQHAMIPKEGAAGVHGSGTTTKTTKGSSPSSREKNTAGIGDSLAGLRCQIYFHL